MLHLTLATASLLVGNAPVRTNTRVSASPVMMPKFIKDLVRHAHNTAFTHILFTDGSAYARTVSKP